MCKKKSKKKKEKKFFKRTFSLAVFLFPVIKRGEKVSGFLKELYKKVKKFFFLSGGFLTIFGR